MVDEFLRDNEIDLAALERLQHRVFVVGRFNQRSKGGPNSEVYLFTNRPPADLADRYRDNFNAVMDLQYESFVRVLRPALSEKVILDRGIPKIVQAIPQDDEAAEGSSLIDIFNFFFQRADATSEQEAFQGKRSGPPKELLMTSSGDWGKSIFVFLRKSLSRFCHFQPRTYEMVEAIAWLFVSCSRQNDMPPYAFGGSLPHGFAEQLIDYLYAEDTREPFALRLTDSDVEPWSTLRTNENARDTFCSTVTAFRDEVLGSRREHHYRFNGKTLNDLARAAISIDLAKEFSQAREAYNSLRQVLRSKVLISMILNWVLTAYYDLQEVQDLPSNATQAEKDEAVERAILVAWERNGLADPLRGVSREEQDKFSRELATNFEHLLKIAFADEASVSGKMAELPAELRSLAERLRRDPQRREALKALTLPVAGAAAGIRQPSVAASEALEALSKRLFSRPALSSAAFRQFFLQETMSAYLSAQFLATKSEETARTIVLKSREYAQGKVDSQTQKLLHAAEVQNYLLDKFIDLIASPADRIAEGIRVIRESQTILSNAPLGAGASAISAVRPDPDLQSSSILRRTEARSTNENALVKILVQSMVTATATNPPISADEILVDTRIERTVKETIKTLFHEFFCDHEAWADATHRGNFSALVNHVTARLLEDNLFMNDIREAVRVFQQVLFLIYQRYNENQENTSFRNCIERLTLINMMLSFQKELSLDTACISWYHLLIDLVQHLDPDNPDLKAFIGEKSLTRYFDSAVLADGGITSLRHVLEAQARDGLQITAGFVSELKGIQYLMEAASNDKEAEIIIVNATAEEFLQWLSWDNLDDAGRFRLRSGLTQGASDGLIQPGLVYLTDIAFTGTNKEQFLAELSNFKMRWRTRSLLLPPLCISTPPIDQEWIQQGKHWAMMAKEAPAPVLVVGPSPFMNRPGDAFRTYLPAGYLLAAHFLCRPDQRIQNRRLPVQSVGRFRVIGSDGMSIRKSLDHVLWSVNSLDDYAFAADFYLYIVLSVLATAVERNISGRVDPKQFYTSLSVVGDWTTTTRSETMPALNRILLGGDTQRFAIQLGEEVNDLQYVTLRTGDSVQRLYDIAWFNIARRNAGVS